MHPCDKPAHDTAGGKIPFTVLRSIHCTGHHALGFHRLELGRTAWVPLPSRELFPVRQLRMGTGKLLISRDLASEAAGPLTY